MSSSTTTRVLKLVGITAAFLFASLLIGAILLALYLRPAAREKAIALLEERFDDVQLSDLDLRLLPGIGWIPHLVAEGEGLSLGVEGRPEAPPFITMDRFTVELGIRGLFETPIRIRRLELDALLIQIPPDEDEEEEGREEEESSSDPSDKPPAFLIQELLADGAVLRIIPEDPEKTPLEFDLHQLRVQSVGPDHPMRFESLLENAKPPGQIDTAGSFGPLRLDDPGRTPVSGQYVFDRADLSVFDGIGGTLHSKGEFGGVLERIEVRGTTETPDFQLKSAGNPVHLKTEFHSIVDGTSGDTLLQPVLAQLATSRFAAEGGVVEETPEQGKTVRLEAETHEARIEDFLRLAVKTEPPFMTGDIRFRSKILIPPGDRDVAEKLGLEGDFQIESAQFTDPAVQEKVAKLSDLGRGKKKSGGEESGEGLDPERIAYDLGGKFHLEGGVMTITDLSFLVPGAEVRLEGTYGLVSEEIDFRGELRLDARLSETTSGVKSFLLKIVEPLFARDGAGTLVPIRLEGTMKEPSFGVDVGRVVRP